ncbi:hypothetical protein QAD02_024341 [Eretmocerus hayati]|uniref:Uncharacterized protein n=1 Tax=Eretmocerus hayati TaxID=131215 RepID=A0ACC2Q038_9HYME|nr:hypothetical protein QAD02_024341 [Eretmocerus hayati]
MHRLILAFIVSSLCFSGQNIFSNAEPIMGPDVEVPKQGEFPFVVSIQIKDNDSNRDGTHVCTGTLISQKHVLTAAHCLSAKNKYNHFEILVGNTDWKKATRHFTNFWIDYNTWCEKRKKKIPEFHLNDLVILILTEKVENARPVHLSSKTNAQLYGLTAQIAGWGISNSGDVPSEMRKANLKILTNTRCEEKYKYINEIEPRFHKATICTQAQPHAVATCGLAGGPLLYKNYKLVGITIGLCFKDVPLSEQVNIHYGIDYFRDFIEDVKRYKIAAPNPMD